MYLCLGTYVGGMFLYHLHTSLYTRKQQELHNNDDQVRRQWMLSWFAMGLGTTWDGVALRAPVIGGNRGYSRPMASCIR